MNKDQLNDVVFEGAHFRQAVIDDFNEEIDSIPTKWTTRRDIYIFSGIWNTNKKTFARDRRRSFF